MRSTHRLVLGLVVIVVAASACRGSSSKARSTTTTTAAIDAIDPRWDEMAGGRGLAVARLVTDASRAKKECADIKAFPRPQFLLTFVGLKWPLPSWAGDCTLAGGENLQVEVWKPELIDRRLETRKARLCNQEGFPGYSYVRGPDFLVIPDQTATARRLAPIVRGTVGDVKCPLTGATVSPGRQGSTTTAA